MQFLIGLGLLVGYVFVINLLTKVISELGIKKQVSQYRVKYVTRILQLGATLLMLVFTALLLGVNSAQVMVFLSSAFAVIGVALFAQWSLLSNITASMVIFFSFPYRVGDRIKVVDKDEDVTGIIESITLFHVIIRREHDCITYPNSLILQKAVIKLNVKKNSAKKITQDSVVKKIRQARRGP